MLDTQVHTPVGQPVGSRWRAQPTSPPRHWSPDISTLSLHARACQVCASCMGSELPTGPLGQTLMTRPTGPITSTESPGDWSERSRAP